MPAGFLTPEGRELIRAHKPAVVAWLRQYATDMLPDEIRLRRWQEQATMIRRDNASAAAQLHHLHGLLPPALEPLTKPHFHSNRRA